MKGKTARLASLSIRNTGLNQRLSTGPPKLMRIKRINNP
jgi:hypothetical protein